VSTPRASRLTLVLAVLVTALTAAAPANAACPRWRVKTMLHDQGWLENLGFDGRGGLTISALVQGRLLRLSPNGRLKTLVPSVSAPGGQVRDGRWLYFNTGDSAPVLPNGTIDRFDLRTGKRKTWARGLTMPNGLVLLPNGDAVVSRDLGTGTGLTRVRARDPRHPQFNWAKIDDTNGLAVDPTGRWLYVDRTLSPDGEVDRIRIAHPRTIQRVGRLGPGVAPDDMTIDRKGILYIAGFTAGSIYRLDPRTHRSCAIATGLDQPTSVRFGGPGWNRRALYATDAGGHLSVLLPPSRR
jgi:SMP-30/Gluconolactonase/LRE-like region